MPVPSWILSFGLSKKIFIKKKYIYICVTRSQKYKKYQPTKLETTCQPCRDSISLAVGKGTVGSFTWSYGESMLIGQGEVIDAGRVVSYVHPYFLACGNVVCGPLACGKLDLIFFFSLLIIVSLSCSEAATELV